MVKRLGFTLLELIVTIVLLGIIFSAVPMILIQNQKLSNEVLSQEAMYAAVAKMSQILSYRWDENSIDDTAAIATVYAKTLDTAGDNNLNRTLGTRYRQGHFPGSSRRAFYPNATNPALGFGLDAEAVPDDIDDNIQLIATPLIATSTQDGYKNNYTYTASISYEPDAASYNANTIGGFAFSTLGMGAAVTSNIKRISIEVQLNGQRQFKLDSFVSNIGEADIISRVFP